MKKIISNQTFFLSKAKSKRNFIMKSTMFFNKININSHKYIGKSLYSYHPPSFSSSQNKKIIEKDEFSNVPEKILSSIGENIYKNPSHPIGIISNLIKSFFSKKSFSIHDSLSPIVNKKDCFYDLLVDNSNETISPKNTYYINKDHVLRTHMTTHDVELLKKNEKSFISIGDVYRRDTVDATHYPVFHQVDGVKVFTSTSKEEVFSDLKATIENLIKSILKTDVQMKWVDAYFPFTEPSAELEIFYEEKWLEILGCGVLRDGVLSNAGIDYKQNTAWAFGIGIERLAMTLFDIKDIRLFWSKDKRFLDQFKNGEISKFKSYSKFPTCFKDFSFYLDEKEGFVETDFHELVRNIGGDIVEEVRLIDVFKNQKTSLVSHCYRVNFRDMDRSLTNEEINDIQFKIREGIVNDLHLKLR